MNRITSCLELVLLLCAAGISAASPEFIEVSVVQSRANVPGNDMDTIHDELRNPLVYSRILERVGIDPEKAGIISKRVRHGE